MDRLPEHILVEILQMAHWTIRSTLGRGLVSTRWLEAARSVGYADIEFERNSEAFESSYHPIESLGRDINRLSAVLVMNPERLRYLRRLRIKCAHNSPFPESNFKDALDQAINLFLVIVGRHTPCPIELDLHRISLSTFARESIARVRLRTFSVVLDDISRDDHMVHRLLKSNADTLKTLDMSNYDDGSDPSAAWVMLDGRSLHALRTLTMGEGGPCESGIDDSAFELDAPNLVCLTATPWIVALLGQCPLAAQIRSLAIVYQYGADAPDLEAFQAVEHLSYGDIELDADYLSALPASLKTLQVDFDNTADGLIEWLSNTYRYERRQMRTIETMLMDEPEEESLAQLKQLRGLCDELGIGLVEK